MIITIDGPSGTGKTTTARLVAKGLGFIYYDTGAMYRAAAYEILQNKIDWKSPTILQSFLNTFSFFIKDIEGEKRYFVGSDDVTHLIRSSSVTKMASQIAVIPQLREALVKLQRQFGKQGNCVFEGRDMGTVVFPDADVKIFLTASLEKRANRRHQEVIHKGETISFEEVLREVSERDELDTNRMASPLQKASDAIEIDTTDLTLDEVINLILKIINSRL